MIKQKSEYMDANGRSDVRTHRLKWLFETAHDLASKLKDETDAVSEACMSGSLEDPTDTHGRLHFQIQREAECDDTQVQLQLLQQDTGDRVKISIEYIDNDA